MLPVWMDLSSSQLLQWCPIALTALVTLVNLAAGQQRGC